MFERITANFVSSLASDFADEAIRQNSIVNAFDKFWEVIPDLLTEFESNLLLFDEISSFNNLFIPHGYASIVISHIDETITNQEVLMKFSACQRYFSFSSNDFYKPVILSNLLLANLASHLATPAHSETDVLRREVCCRLLSSFPETCNNIKNVVLCPIFIPLFRKQPLFKRSNFDCNYFF